MPDFPQSDQKENAHAKGFLTLLEALPHPALLVEEGKILHANDASLLFYGRTRTDLLGKQYKILLAESPQDEMEMSIPEEPFLLQTHRSRDGSELKVEVATSSTHLHGRPVTLCVIRDITRQLMLEGELNEKVSRFQYLAYHDSLTGLPNRLLFHDRMEHALAVARRTEKQLALLFIDVDYFKKINDTWGHEAGDEVLIEVAQRMRRGLREADTLARMGGDEFLVILEQVQGGNQVNDVIRRMQNSLAAEVNVAGRSVRISVSIGASLFPVHATDSKGLLNVADRALLLAKEQGRNSCYFEPTPANA